MLYTEPTFRVHQRYHNATDKNNNSCDFYHYGVGALGNADWILLYGTNNSRNPAPKNMKHLIILIIFFMIHNLLKIFIQQNSLQSIFT